MHIGKLITPNLFGRILTLFTMVAPFTMASAQGPSPSPPQSRPWTDETLPPGYAPTSLDEKLALLHGIGRAGAPNSQMPRTYFTNGGECYVLGVSRLDIPPIVMSDAAYGVRCSDANGRYSIALS